MANMISEKLNCQINQTLFHIFSLCRYLGVRHNQVEMLRSEIELLNLLCLVGSRREISSSR